jgi:hypothetical protein
MAATRGPRPDRAGRSVLGRRRAPRIDEPPQDVDAWVAASREPADPASNPPAASAPSRSGAVGEVAWSPAEEDRRGVVLRRVGRGVFWTVLGLAAVTGVRSWVAPERPAPPPAAVPAAAPAPSFPAEAARAVAARWARAYLSWDPARSKDREVALAADMPAAADGRQGWNQAGRLDVLDVLPGTVDPSGPARARVRVDVLVRTPLPPDPSPTSAGTAQPAAPPSPAPEPAAAERWVALDIPVAVTGTGRVVVTGAPGVLGLPTARPDVPAASARPADSELGAATQEAVRGFFAAAGGGDVAALAAPGAQVAPLPPGFVFAALRQWQVDVGSGATRSGTATVLWQVGGGQLEQVYRVEVTQVSSASGQRWQVASVRGGDV